MLWKERNKRTFDNVSATMSMVLLRIREVGDEWIAAGYRALVRVLLP
jgi:hypothetical protein